MPETARIRKVGGSLMVALPKIALSRHKLGSGSSVTVEVTPDGILLRAKRPTLADMLAECEPGPFEVDRTWVDTPPIGKEEI